jgi:hypothetical protein
MPDDPSTQTSREALETERLRIQREINSYPAPIPACDVYFNDLLDQRSRICEAIRRSSPPARTLHEPG